MILTRDEAFKVVCNFRTPSSDGTKVILGTGMFVTDEKKVWIVTASHVAKSTNENTILALSDQESNCITIYLKDLNKQLEWKNHGVADLAVFPIDITEENSVYLNNRCLPLDHINFKETHVSRDVELTSAGFPQGLGVEGKFSPLTFRSYASSALLSFERFDTHTLSDFFCLENPSVGGYSGCPVFDLGYMVVGGMTTTKEKTICYGFMHGTLGDDTGGKLAVVTPSYYLKDLV